MSNASEDRSRPAEQRSEPKDPVVSLRSVTKHYRGVRGIENVNLEVFPGEVFAFLGPNGAGKTTTIRLLLDLIRPDSGQVLLFGRDNRRHSVESRRRIGYLPGDLGLYEHLTAREILTHFAYLRGGPSWSVIAKLVETLDLDPGQPVKTLSKGNRQKVGLIQALMGSPPLLVLDEPTSGLDPLVQNQVHVAIRAAASEGRSVFLSSHVLSEVASIADRVGILRDGRIVQVATVLDLRATAVHYVDVSFNGEDAVSELVVQPNVEVLSSRPPLVSLRVIGSLDPVVHALARHSIADLSIREPDLEELFLGAMGEGAELVTQRDSDGAS